MMVFVVLQSHNKIKSLIFTNIILYQNKNIIDL